MTTIEVHGLGTRCPLRLEGDRVSELADAVTAAWSRCLAPVEPHRDADPVTVALHADDEPRPNGTRVAGSDLDTVMQGLTQQVTLANIAAQTGQLFMFHAGAVVDPATGDALAFVAPGGTGKTTLARALGAQLGYLTDETVGCTPDGIIRPYPKPLSIRPPDYTGTKHETSPDSLGLGATPPEARLRRVVLLDRRVGLEGAPRFTPLDTVSAIAELAPETSALSSMPRPLQSLADLIEAGPPVVRVTYAEASDITDDLVALLREAS